MNDAVNSLLTEHFSYTPLSLIDDIINSINNLIYQAISSLETGLLNTPPERLGFGHAHNASTAIPDTDADGNIEYPEATLEIENGLHQLETLFESSVDKSFDKFEIYVLRNIFTVPEDLVNYMRLGHYENLSFSKDSNAPTPESINMQRRKLRETRKLQQALQRESMQNEAVISQLRAVLFVAQDTAQKQPVVKTDSSAPATSSTSTLPNLSFLTSGPAANMLRVGQNNSLTTNTDFVLSQLPALHAATQKLRAKLATLPTSVPSESLKRDERREYIDSRIRLHLERLGEPLLGDGQAAIAGRKISSAEAQALEAVGNMLNEK
ncbi:MIND kinetochore complex component Mtw1, putative [Talaromyces stipitatus ATCC 10500]|uniref:MIND kinetochore complex component Mtw1, putative n=1 Tax=Talaromyces stipitatus (strain ATCC 10500 / CBS 375.48 / QM 6759 / NRRL 1006) TaxID=441959 RepID=B8M3E2_TALSN|nr:MIND kinetochore complex component Mtw1, putative [Talaromyces stipitatus ATCC 10500]EED22314.1 MIND kinetochore complex component Mtw1, putative [Talaromyces stipitatus ATCC 10500]